MLQGAMPPKGTHPPMLGQAKSSAPVEKFFPDAWINTLHTLMIRENVPYADGRVVLGLGKCLIRQFKIFGLAWF